MLGALLVVAVVVPLVAILSHKVKTAFVIVVRAIKRSILLGSLLAATILVAVVDLG